MSSSNALSTPRAADTNPEYPDTLSPATRDNVVVPFPRELNPEWTTQIPRFKLAPTSFPQFISLPDPLVHPALYAAAADTIRITNWTLTAHMRGEGDDPILREIHVEEAAQRWRTAFPDEAKYLFPPDLRTLYVNADDVQPMAKNAQALWTQACEEWQEMSAFERPGFLVKTRARHIQESNLVDGLDFKNQNKTEGEIVLEMENRLYKRIFKRYLAWDEHVRNQDGKEDVQPTRNQMRAFFERPEVKQKGATLADICHAFPDAQDVEMLVYRIEGFAVHTPKEDQDSEPVESVYMPREAPTKDEIEDRVTETLSENGPLSLEEIVESLYPFSFGYEEAIAATVRRIATTTTTGGNFGLGVRPCPSAARIQEILSETNGRNYENLLAWSTDRLLEEDALLAPLGKIAYQDDDGLWYLRFLDDDGEPIMDNNVNRQLRSRQRIRAMYKKDHQAFANLLEDVAVWDSTAGRYVKKTQSLGPIFVQKGVETEPVPPPSPTEVGSSPPPSPVKGSKRKRAGDEPEQLERKTKHPRPAKGHPGDDDDTQLVRCSGYTLKRTRCKLEKRLPAGQAYDCGKHR